jgi:hypothetical protein
VISLEHSANLPTSEVFNFEITCGKSMEWARAVATLILNFCVKLHPSEDLENKSKCLQAAGEVLNTNFDPEAVYRILVGVGTLVAQDDGCKALAHSIDLPQVISKLNTSDVGKLAECSKLITQSLNS